MANDALMLRGDVVAAADLARQALDQGPTSMAGVAMSYATLSMCAAVDGQFERALEILFDGQDASAALNSDSLHTKAFYEILIARAEATRGDPSAARLHAAGSGTTRPGSKVSHASRPDAHRPRFVVPRRRLRERLPGGG